MAGKIDLMVSPRLLHGLQTVPAREKFRRYFTHEEAAEYVSWLHHGAKVVRDPAESVVRGAVEADPDDEYLVGLAATLVGGSYLVSVDHHLLDLPGRAVKEGEGRILARILTPVSCSARETLSTWRSPKRRASVPVLAAPRIGTAGCTNLAQRGSSRRETARWRESGSWASGSWERPWR